MFAKIIVGSVACCNGVGGNAVPCLSRVFEAAEVFQLDDECVIVIVYGSIMCAQVSRCAVDVSIGKRL